MRDRYQEQRVPKVKKGISKSGRHIVSFEHTPSAFVNSDATNRPIRFYVVTPKGHLIHPSTKRVTVRCLNSQLPAPKSIKVRRAIKGAGSHMAVLEDGLTARYTVSWRSGRPVAVLTALNLGEFNDEYAKAIRKPGETRKEAQAWRRALASEVLQKLQAQLDTDFLDGQIRAAPRAEAARRAAATRAKKKAAGIAKRGPTKTEAQAAVLKLERQVQALTESGNRARSATSRKAFQKRRQRALGQLLHWRLVEQGKRSTYPKGWRR